MKNEQIYNPYLPLTTYIPDGEPHIFDDRLYIYGSHDRAGGTAYCEEDYQVWSAPVTNLRDWRNDGNSYCRMQDTSNPDGDKQLWAPDVTRGVDGKYYMYYCLNFYPEIGVAVSDYPEGPFHFIGHVHYRKDILEGKILDEGMVFDPAVLTDDDGRIYLYYGFAPACEKEMKIPDFSQEEFDMLPEEYREKLKNMHMDMLKFGENSMVVELEADMITAKEEPHILIPGGHHTKGTGFEGHGFFEASSIRKIRGKYYFVYSSHKSHELCYAISDKPNSGFKYGGTIISNGDIGLDGRVDPVCPIGNNHGGIVEINNNHYIFYHRQTNGTEFSRQGCAEKIVINEDGSIQQVPITSCGLNGEALIAEGVYPAAIACHLTDPTVKNNIDYNDPAIKQQICITEHQNCSFITNIADNAVVGYKYFSFKNDVILGLELCGSFDGKVEVSHDEKAKEVIGTLKLHVGRDEWAVYSVPVMPKHDNLPLYLHFSGKGKLDFKSLIFYTKDL